MNRERQFWLVVGIPANWKTAFGFGNIWGLRDTPRQVMMWEQLQEEDVVIFYATRPVGGVIGYGKVRTKFKQDNPLWPKEIRENRLIWPYRFEFDVEHLIPPDEWETSGRVIESLKPLVRSGFQMLDRDTANEVIGAFGMTYKPLGGRQGGVKDGPLTHQGIKNKLIEIGKMQQFIAGEEYSADGMVLDVVWRRVEKSVPTYVFEVQLGGDMYHALAKLKHAFDLWNSHIFLITTGDQKSRAYALLSGTFHEIRERIRVIELKEIQELHSLKKNYKEFEKKLGIL